ncbi:hypothetical protein KGF48_01120 [Clostridioides sp. ZZV15-6388]|uniref:hypothetical protein n=2 Tax=unclassified Clostridioides TaxID=2635829 RepID=UPI001D0FD115|nr:hypothetical protein [Clostridioides sp. ZZV15-6388]
METYLPYGTVHHGSSRTGRRFQCVAGKYAYDEFFQSHEEWKFYMKVKMSEYINNYMSDIKISIYELLEIKKLIQRQKMDRLMKCYKVWHSIDRCDELLKGYQEE